MKQIIEALIKARASVGARVFKEGKNKAQDYRYVGHEQVIEHVRKALTENGLAVVQTKVEHVGELATKSSSVWRWRGTFHVYHSSGESIGPVEVEATTVANDKAAFVASTALDRTVHMRLMGLAGTSEEDPEHDVHDSGPLPRTETPRAQPERPTTVKQRVNAELDRLGIPDKEKGALVKLLANGAQLDEVVMATVLDRLRRCENQDVLGKITRGDG